MSIVALLKYKLEKKLHLKMKFLILFYKKGSENAVIL